MADSRKRMAPKQFDGQYHGKKKFDFTNVAGFRFLIPSKAGGCMIGKGGEVIKRLRSEFNCRIIVPDSQGPERMLILDGNIDTIIDFWNNIIPSIKDSISAKENDFKSSGNELDLRLIIHESQAGALIGKGGERIRNLIDIHKMSMIKLYHGLCPHSSDRVVRLVGGQESLMECLRSMLALLEIQIIKGPRADYDPDNYDELAAPNYGGYISTEPRFASRAGHNKPGGDNYADYVPRLNSFEYSTQYDDADANPVYFRPPNPRVPVYVPQSSGGGGCVSDLMGGIIRLNPIDDGQKLMSRVTLPIYLVNAVIGTDGHRLSDIKRDSGAHVQLDDERLNDREELFLINGSADQIYKAKCLMQLCARKYGDLSLYGY